MTEGAGLFKEKLSETETELDHIRSDPPDAPGAKMPWREILRHRQAWAFVVAKMMTDPVWWFFLTWLPDYFKKARHLDLKSSAVYLVNDLVDIEFDRRHPTKRYRPLASARLTPRAAAIAAVVLLLAAAGVAATLSSRFMIVLAAFQAVREHRVQHEEQQRQACQRSQPKPQAQARGHPHGARLRVHRIGQIVPGAGHVTPVQ